MELTPYEQQALQELKAWQRTMQKAPSSINQLAKQVQDKINSYIPEKVHEGITTTLKQMIRGVLFGSELTTPWGLGSGYSTLQEREQQVLKRIEFYKRAGAAEGGITGAGGFLMGLADFPLLLGIKLKLLFDIASLYGYPINDYRERLYLLHIFQLAFSSGQHRRQVFRQMLNWEQQKQQLPQDINQFNWRTLQQEYRDYIDLAKMAQLIPVIGAPVGAVVNYRLLNKLGRTAMNAYRMRWLEQQQAAS